MNSSFRKERGKTQETHDSTPISGVSCPARSPHADTSPVVTCQSPSDLVFSLPNKI